jgi:hypothetical protein
VKRYIVQPTPGFAGLEFLADSPVGRRIYQSGEEAEFDESRQDIKQAVKDGRIIELKHPPAKAVQEDKEE